MILIREGFDSVIETKKKVYQNYKEFFKFERFYLQHVNEQYAELAKLSALQKVRSLRQYVDLVKDNIPLQKIEIIVKKVASRALSKESILRLCFDVVLQGIGNTNSDPYNCYSVFTVRRLKLELVRETIKSINNNLGFEITAEILEHMKSDIYSSFAMVPNSTEADLVFQVRMISTSMNALVSSLNSLPVIPNVLSDTNSFLFTLLLPVNVNSQSWRRNVATEINELMDKNAKKFITDVSLAIKRRFRITVDQLKLIADQLENFESRVYLHEQDTSNVFYLFCFL